MGGYQKRGQERKLLNDARTRTSLLVTVDIMINGTPNGTMLAGEVADGTGTSAFGPSSDSANVGFTGLPPETLAPDAALPFVDLGSFAPNEAKPFSLMFTYTFGDGRSCDVASFSCRTQTSALTLAPVPELGTLGLLGAGVLGLLAAGRRSGVR